MIAAGEKRGVIEALDDLDDSSLFGSVLEKKLVDRLEAAVIDSGGECQKTLVSGTSGFRFRSERRPDFEKSNSNRSWPKVKVS
jgi:DEAD/DEAH box helicase domain-containing protein